MEHTNRKDYVMYIKAKNSVNRFIPGVCDKFNVY